jgi:hydroxypyruvate isomerase
MIVGESHIGDADVPARRNAFRAHCQWIEVAKALGCHSIQVDATSSGSANQQRLRAIDGLNAICEYAAKRNINVLVGDYGGVSANPAWVLDVITTVNMPGCGTLPQIKEVATDQDYEGLASIVPFARGIRATTTAFDDSGHEKHTDYDRAMKVVQGAGYGGYVGIHYSGIDIDELAGIRATKSMLERIRRAMPSSADERPS